MLDNFGKSCLTDNLVYNTTDEDREKKKSFANATKKVFDSFTHFNRFREALVNSEITAASKKKYLENFKLFNTYLSQNPKVISIQDSFAAYRRLQVKIGTKQSTMNVRVAAVNKYIELVMKGYGGSIKTIKGQVEDLPPKFENKEERDLSVVWDKYKEDLTCIAFYIGILFGLRISEIAGLRKSDISKEVDLQKKEYIKIKIHCGKGSKYGEVYSKDPLAFLVCDFIVSSNLNNFMFFDEDKQETMTKNLLIIADYKDMCLTRSNLLSRQIRSFTKDVFNEGVPAHALRRYFANTHYKNNVPIEQISSLMRHSQLQNTLLYISKDAIKDSVLAELGKSGNEESKEEIYKVYSTKVKKRNIKEQEEKMKNKIEESQKNITIRTEKTKRTPQKLDLRSSKRKRDQECEEESMGNMRGGNPENDGMHMSQLNLESLKRIEKQSLDDTIVSIPFDPNASFMDVQ
jgi:integrase